MKHNQSQTMNFRNIFTRSATGATLLAIISAHPITLNAGPRSSANYTIATDTADAGGRRTSSTNYTNDGSAGSITGVSTVSIPAETAKHGYVGQLYEVTGFALTSASPNVNENSTLQLGPSQFLDDTSLFNVNASSVAWNVVSGPITGISSAGLATAGTVYQNTPATVQGAFGGFANSLILNVLDFVPDNFGSYAGDGVGDDWQVQYFGQPPNANAGPNVDFDGTGQTNLFKYIAGLNPLDPNSRFLLRVEPVPGQPSRKNLVFSPLVEGRTYEVKSSISVTGAWQTISQSTTTDAGEQRTVTDLHGTGTAKFYHVEITKP